ncbi:MAG: nitroreductase family protein [Defluviitaleaceae bacterium]|nr:nitroreductase family protein [Defluviitaleaceae bacterium]
MSTSKIIRKRKSIRKYDLTPLDTATLEKVQAQFESLIIYLQMDCHELYG